MAERLRWERDSAHWPLRQASRFVTAGGVRWHVQRLGPTDAPAVLLIHGTGAATHSWRLLAPLLATDLHVVAVDLPGHGFSALPAHRQMSLPGMAAALGKLLEHLGVAPVLVVGHSAGAAIGARMVLDGHVRPRALVALNGALLPLSGPAGRLFSPIAKLLAFNPFVPAAFAWMARDAKVVQRLLDATGSKIDEEGAALYGRLVADPGHAAGALAMMAQWDLVPLASDLARLPVPLHLIVADRDLTVPPAQAQRVRRRVPRARLHEVHGLGHLAHEERPELVATLLRRILAEPEPDAGAPR